MPEDFAMAPPAPATAPQLDSSVEGLRIILPSEVSAVHRALGQIKICLASLNLNTEEQGTFEIVVAEALNNIIEHAYSDYSGVLEVVLERQTDGLNIVITDDGLEMPEGQVPLGELVDYPEELPEGGFGWFLIHDLTRELTYSRQDDRNVLRFRLAMGALDK